MVCSVRCILCSFHAGCFTTSRIMYRNFREFTVQEVLEHKQGNCKYTCMEPFPENGMFQGGTNKVNNT